ncbi:type VI secretion system Vgr family protein [Paraburkholderia pallida]|nr:type VI secretion system Vgr family protein [Paraburkholderia pallida]
MWPDYVCTLRNYFSPVRMRGPELPERVVVLEWRKRQKEFRQDVLLPQRVWGTEAIGQLFEYHIEAYCSVHDPKYFGNDDYEIDLDAIKGTQITLVFSDAYEKEHRRYWPLTKRDRTGEREISGMVESAEIASAEGDALVYQFVIRPWWWRATLCKNSRVFVGMDAAIPNILRNVLSKYSNDIEFRFNQGLEARHNAFRRDFIRQAWETDWDFCMRLCEEFGYVVWFEHHDEKHVLVIADNTRGCQEQSLPYDTLEYRPEGGHHQRVHIADLSWRTSVAVEKITVTDHSYISPRLSRNSLSYRAQYSVKGEDESQTNFHGRLQSYEPAEYAQPDTHYRDGRDAEDWEADAQHLARVKLEAQRGQRKRVRGRGELSGLEVAKTFTLTDHPYDNANGDYLVLACKLDIRGAPGPSELFLHYSFDASFELLPKDEPYRMPQVTERPRLRDKEYAVIVGSADFEMTIDEYNRVRIQYAWDRQGDFTGRNSIWVRVAQPWQGNQMGTVMHGRHGQQVIVDYINGDPDRPIVTAFVPDVNNMPAWKLPKNQALTGIVTRSFGRGATTNHLAFDDTPGRQQVQLASDHAKSSLSLGYITRIDGNAGRQEARGEGFELRTDLRGVLRAFGMLITTSIREKAAGKVKDMGETHTHLTEARGIHEALAQSAQRHGAQETTDNQTDVTRAIKDANAALRGNVDDEFPEFGNPDIVLASAANLHATAEHNTHFFSRENTALTTGGNVAIAAAKSLFVSVGRVVSFFAYKSMSLIARELVRIESRTNGIDMTARGDLTQTSTGGAIKLAAPNYIEFKVENTTVRLTPQGFFVFTNGQYLVHAAKHATDDPQAPPVLFPVTPENAGKLVAHHVLVESGGGFTVPNQPYRLTLDDGQVIQGVTNELGELQMATSNAVSFGMVEFRSQSSPEDVIGMTRISVYRDASLPPPPIPPIPARRTAQIGGKTASTPGEGPTTQAQAPDFIGCDPLNFGLRTCLYLNKAKPNDEEQQYDYRHNVDYPVAKKYTAAVKKELTALDWDGLAGKSADEIGETVVAAIKPTLWEALSSGAFGLPKGSSSLKDKPGAMPEIVFVTPENAANYGFEKDYLGGFVGIFWIIAINISKINRIIENKGGFRAIDVSELAGTFYHEARHCQQKFWMISLFSNHRDDYKHFKNMDNYVAATVRESVRNLALSTPFPADDRVRIGVHRMLIFDYYWSIIGTTGKSGFNFLQADAAIAETELCKLLAVTPEQARQMADRKSGYRSHLHEEDAFICGELVDLYWNDPDRTQLRNPGTCTKQYRETITRIKGSDNA